MSAEPERISDALEKVRAKVSRLTPSGDSHAYTPQTFAEAREMAEYLAKSELIPAAFRGKPADIILAASHGAKLGFDMATSLLSIYVVGAKPALYVDAAHAVCRKSGLLESIHLVSDEHQATATVRRKGGEEHSLTFTFDQAQRMGLTRNPSWQSQREWMLGKRALGRVLNLAFPDVLKGLGLVDPAGGLVDMPDESEAPAVAGGNGGKLTALTERLATAPEPSPPDPPSPEPQPDPPAPEQPSATERAMLLSLILKTRDRHNIPERAFANLCRQAGIEVKDLGKADMAALNDLAALVGHRKESKS
jgi:hypothetical protein